MMLTPNALTFVTKALCLVAYVKLFKATVEVKVMC